MKREEQVKMIDGYLGKLTALRNILSTQNEKIISNKMLSLIELATHDELLELSQKFIEDLNNNEESKKQQITKGDK